MADVERARLLLREMLGPAPTAHADVDLERHVAEIVRIARSSLSVTPE